MDTKLTIKKVVRSAKDDDDDSNKTGFKKIVPIGTPTTPVSFTPATLKQYQKMYKDLSTRWSDLSYQLSNFELENFNSSKDREEIIKLLSEFNKIMSFFRDEMDPRSVRTASVEMYDDVTNTLNEMVQLFDKYKPDFEKFAKNVELENNTGNQVTVDNLLKASGVLDKLADLFLKNKESLSKNPKNELGPNGTVKMKASTKTINAAVKLLIEAANRLDLRPPTQKSKEQLAELLSYMKALRECYQAMHWVSRGEPYYGDHHLFSQLYEALAEEVDGLAEKAIGYTDDAYIVEVQYQTSRMATHVSEIMSFLPDMTNIQCMLNAEKKLTKEIVPKMLNDLEQAGELSDGLENFLQGIADAHESSIYHLQRRLKTQKDLSELGPVEPNISPPPEPTPEVGEEFDTMLEEENVV